MSTPNPQAVQEFGVITDTLHRREIALDYLKHNQNDVERAVDEWFNRGLDPDLYKNQQATLVSGQYGPVNQMQAMPPDDWSWAPLSFHPLGTDPMSRPPSRNTLAKDEHKAWTGQETSNDEDAQMREAIERSRHDHEATTTVAAKILDPEPKERYRGVSGEPAFLKPLPNRDFLPSLITILHSIPNVRKELLSKDDILPHYGHNDHWWEGEPIESSQIISSFSPNDAEPSLQIIHETQRLMAFLDLTSRAYGSVEALTKVMPTSNPVLSEGVYGRFLQEWDTIATSEASSTQHDMAEWNSLFTSKRIKVAQYQALPSRCTPSVQVIIGSESFPEGNETTLHDALDNAVLGDEADRMIMYEDLAPVFVIRMDPGYKTRHIQVPSVLFTDRYLEENADYVQSSKKLMIQEQSRIDDIMQKLGTLETFRVPDTSRSGSAAQLMSTAIGYLQARNNMPAITSAVTGEPLLSDVYNAEQSVKIQQTLERLEEINNCLKDSCQKLNDEQEERKKNIRSYLRAGTDPEDPQFRASKKYRLRGVATAGYHHPTVTYAIYPTRRFGVNGLLGSRVEQQWWKLIYDTRYTAVVRTERVTEDQVLQAASQVAVQSNTLLIYANDDFLNTESDDFELPSQLREFVESDNETFRAEFRGDDPAIPIIEGVPVGDRSWNTTDSDFSIGEPASTFRDETQLSTDPAAFDSNEDIPEKALEMEEIHRNTSLSPKKRKSDEFDSDMETMAAGSDNDMDWH